MDSDNSAVGFPHTWFAFGVTIALMIFYFTGGAMMLFGVGGENAPPHLMALAQGASQLVFMLAAALAVTRLSPLGTKHLLRLGNPSPMPVMPLLYGLLGVVAVGIFGYGWLGVQDAILPTAVSASIRESFESYNKLIMQLLGGDDAFAIVRALAVGAVIPAVSEEVLFRGIMQRSLEESLGAPVAITHTAILFALIHFNMAQILPLIAIGIVFGSIASATRSLVPGIILHTINNSFAVLTIHNSTLLEWDTSMSTPEFLPAVLMSVAGGGIIVFCVWMLNKRPHRSPVTL